MFATRPQHIEGAQSVYHKAVEPGITRYALSSNPRDGAISRTYFPPSSYDISQQEDFLHREITRRNLYHFKNPAVSKRNVSRSYSSTNDNMGQALAKLPPIRLGERILEPYQPGSNRTDVSGFQPLAVPANPTPADPKQTLRQITWSQSARGAAASEKKTEMQRRFEAEEEYLEKVRLNKKLSAVYHHRIDRFYYLQGGQARLQRRSNFQPHNTPMQENAFLTQEASVKNPINEVSRKNSRQTPKPGTPVQTKDAAVDRSGSISVELPLENSVHESENAMTSSGNVETMVGMNNCEGEDQSESAAAAGDEPNQSAEDNPDETNQPQDIEETEIVLPETSETENKDEEETVENASPVQRPSSEAQTDAPTADESLAEDDEPMGGEVTHEPTPPETDSADMHGWSRQQTMDQ